MEEYFLDNNQCYLMEIVRNKIFINNSQNNGFDVFDIHMNHLETLYIMDDMLISSSSVIGDCILLYVFEHKKLILLSTCDNAVKFIESTFIRFDCQTGICLTDNIYYIETIDNQAYNVDFKVGSISSTEIIKNKSVKRETELSLSDSDIFHDVKMYKNWFILTSESCVLCKNDSKNHLIQIPRDYEALVSRVLGDIEKYLIVLCVNKQMKDSLIIKCLL